MADWTDHPRNLMAMAPATVTALGIIEEIAVAAITAVEGDPIGTIKGILEVVALIRAGFSNAVSPAEVATNLKTFTEGLAANDTAANAAAANKE